MTTIDLTEPTPKRRHWQIFGLWTAAVILYALALNGQVNLPIQYALITSAFYYYTLAGFMIPVSRWTNRLHRRQATPLAVVAQHIAIGLVVVLLWQALILLYTRLAVGPNFWQLTYAPSWRFQLVTAAATYGTALGLNLAFQASDRERERERRESELMIIARDSELATIKAQMQPHFVLNVLNSLLVLIEKDPALAKTMVNRLSEMMRAIFEQFEVEQIPLRKEIELTKAYLDIERIRFGPRLSINIDVDAEAEDAIVPAFVLQPIVENAIKHGIALQTGPGELRIAAECHRSRLSVAVSNTRKPGTGPAPHASTDTGRGLQLTRRRLSTTYGDDQQLTFDADGPLVTVTLDLPARTYEHETVAAAPR